MEINDLINKFSDTPEKQCKAIFNTLFIVTNKLQTTFDQHIPDITLKQFMLLTLIKQSSQPLILTQLGELLGCSRQNVKKLATILEKKGFVKIKSNQFKTKGVLIEPTKKMKDYFNNDFVKFEAELKYLFANYTKEEINQLFILMMKLYPGINNLKEKIANDK